MRPLCSCACDVAAKRLIKVAKEEDPDYSYSEKYATMCPDCHHEVMWTTIRTTGDRKTSG